MNNNNNEQDPFTVFQSQTAPLKLRVIPSVSHALNGVKNQLSLLFQLKTAKVETQQKRTPVDLAIVLDRSGSMRGEKLENSKRTIKKVIDNLTSDDRIHLIVYDDKADIIFENGDLREKQALQTQVDHIKDRGSTNLCAGVQLAEQVLQHSSLKNCSKRIFLFSDGRVNVGIQDPAGVRRVISNTYNAGIETTSFGIGEDFDEDLMKGIAESGHSYYFYIESADQIDKYVSAALGALLGVLGKNAVLKVRGKNGAVVTKMYGHPDLIKGAVIGDIKQDNLKSILVDLDYTPSVGGIVEVASYELSFISNKENEGEVKVTGVIVLPSTDEEKAMIKNPEVDVAITIQKTADMDDEIVSLLEKGKHKEALSKKQEEISLLSKMEEVDKTSRVSAALKKAKKAAEDLVSRPDSKHMMKEAKHHAMLKRMDSCDFLEL